MDLGALGFWLFLAAVVASSIIASAMKEKSLHRLIETSIDKTGAIDPKLAELLESEIQRKARAEVLGRPDSSGWVRKVLSVVVGFLGLPFGLFTVPIVVRPFTGAASRPDPGVILGALGAGAAVFALFVLMAWLIWPKSKRSSDSEPRL
jgi:hypothetical protein